MNPVEPIWRGETAVILACGPSLTVADVNACRGRAKVIAIKDAVTLAPWADALYFCGAEGWKGWWQTHEDLVRDFAGLTFTLDARAAHLATVLRAENKSGLSIDPTTLRTGKNSGFQAIGLAVLLGVTRIVLLGYDMQVAGGRTYFFGAHAYQRPTPPFHAFLEAFLTLVEPLKALGIRILNATRSTALTCFPCVSLEEALA